METRLILDAPAPGPWNMAVDEVLLEAAAGAQQAVLRFYRWSSPTLSLGYFQTHRSRELHRPSLGLPWLRRSTGGGAILHDQELTYSFTCPAPARSAVDTQRLYDAFHETLVEVLAQFGVIAGLYAGNNSPVQDEPFLCFLRRSRGDVMVQRHKIAGSAQRRHRGAVLQHGSLLLGRSHGAPELPGIFELTGKDVAPSRIHSEWVNRLEKRLSLRLRHDELTPDERAAAENVVVCRFEEPGWNERR